MKPLEEPLDSNFLIRYFHIHCFIHMFRVFRATRAAAVFSLPRFEMFRPIRRLFSSSKSKGTPNSLFKNLIFTYKEDVGFGMLITFIFASLNLLVPQLIKAFMNFMKENQNKKSEIISASHFTEYFVLLQLLRMIFGEHTKRLFHQLAIKIESTLAKRLIEKSLRMAKEITDRYPPQELIYRLQNVDLKLTFTLFKNLYLIFQAPFTVIVALGLIFFESPSYGLIAIYWFFIAFLIQRELDQKMQHCNSTKLGLIDKRSKINYWLLKQMKSAKISGCESMMIEKNNDLFMQENHDHHQFYFYSTLYDISLLMLPIMVVVSIALLDSSEEQPITIQEVYVMMSLLGICYNPMKSLRVIAINFHDGLHSLENLTKFFTLPDQIQTALIKKNSEIGELLIKKNTISSYPHLQFDFWLIIDKQIQARKGDRMNVLGRKGQGSSSFVHMLVGNMKKIRGNVFMNGKLAYLPENNFFSNTTVKQNISFFNKETPDARILDIFMKLGLKEDLGIEGLNLYMNDDAKFTASALQKISLARIFCSDADIYLLDNPFKDLSLESIISVEKILRQKQKDGKLIICAMKNLESANPKDLILILDEGTSKQFGTFQELFTNPQSLIKKFFKRAMGEETEEDIQKKKLEDKKRVISNFQKRVHRALSYNKIIETLSRADSSIKDQTQTVQSKNTHKQIVKPLEKYSLIIKKEIKDKRYENRSQGLDFLIFLWKFLRSAALSESLLIYIIIIAAQILHIFIHFYIGHEYQEHQENDLGSFRNLMIIEVILTIGLAGILYLEGEVSSHLAIIKGNVLYKESLTSLVGKSMSWFSQQFSVKIADKFNHDYEEIFIAWHDILNIYKNIVILIATIFFVSSNKENVIIITFFIGVIYFSILLFLRNIQSKVVRHYYDYKYEYVKIFQESIQGAELIRIFNVKNEFIERTKWKYSNLAAYKLAESYTSYGEQLLCDLVSIILLAIALEYGLSMKIHGRSTAFIATTIFLLMNLSDVLKSIVKLTVNLESYFSLNLQPFLEINSDIQDAKQSIDRINKEENQEEEILTPIPLKPNKLNIQYQFEKRNQIDEDLKMRFHIEFRNALISEESLDKKVKRNRITLKIAEADKILFLEKNDRARDDLLYALTRNYERPKKTVQSQNTVYIGDKKIEDFKSQEMPYYVGVIADQNFFMNQVTLGENISWKVPHFDHQKADEYCRLLELDKELPNYEDDGLMTKIQSVEGKLNSQFSKKLALIRILSLQPKIIIIKDTPSFVGSLSIVELIDKHLPDSTIIKISNKIETSFDIDRIVYMEDLKILEDGHRITLYNTGSSDVGKMLRQTNIEGYLYTNMASVSPRKQFKARNLLGVKNDDRS